MGSTKLLDGQTDTRAERRIDMFFLFCHSIAQQLTYPNCMEWKVIKLNARSMSENAPRACDFANKGSSAS